MNSYVRTRDGRMVHRRYGCPSGNPMHAMAWNWADGMNLQTLIAEFTSIVGHDPAIRLCGHCFGRNERATWFSRVQTRAAP